MENNLGFKDLYDVVLKTTYPIELDGRTIEAGEVIALFDKVMIANFDEKKNFISAKGGYDNRAHVWWEETKEIRISLAQGVFSKTHFALMTNAHLAKEDGKSIIPVFCREEIEAGANGVVILQHMPVGQVFVYNKKTGEKIDHYISESTISTSLPAFTTVIVDYYYNYDNGYSIFTIGRALTNGYLSLEGKTRVKDDITGQVITGIITIPKLKLMSNLSMRLGQDAIPVMGRLDAVAIPTGTRGQKKLMELVFLNDDIDSDM